MTDERSVPPIDPELADVEIDIRTPHSARIYDYLLGGRVNFEVDREAAKASAGTWPGGLHGARHDIRINREFMRRAVQHLVTDIGLRQFVDVGTGIPAHDNAHGVAQTAAPECRILYVDNDPIVMSHAHQLLNSTPEGSTDYLWGDFRTPEKIIARAEETLDLTQPVGLLIIGMLHVIPDSYDPRRLIQQLMEPLASGSHLAISQISTDIIAEAEEGLTLAAQRINELMGSWNPVAFRRTAEIAPFFEGLEMTEKGLVPADTWRPDNGEPHGFEDRTSTIVGGVARKP